MGDNDLFEFLPRLSVNKFSMEMERVLRRYDNVKGSSGWLSISENRTVHKLIIHIEELINFYKENRRQETGEACIHLANYAMMLHEKIVSTKGVTR